MRESVAAIKRHRTTRLAKLVGKSYYLHKRGRDVEMSNLVCGEFVKFGGVYIKFLQGVLLQSELMRRWTNPDRLKIFENLDHELLNLEAILDKELPGDKRSQIALVQPQPFAAGSFGQVYYGQHANGKPIIIKVLRPMIRELLRYDLKLLAAFSKNFFLKLHKNMDYHIETAIDDFRLATLRETDYIEEAKFGAELYEIYKGNPHLIIPETFRDLCTPHIIVQEYIPGLSVAQLIKLKQQGVDPQQYVQEQLGSDLKKQLADLGYEFMISIFNLTRIQGDPHPGNVRLMTGNRVGLIDFGIQARTPKNKAAFFGMIEEWDRLYSGTQSIANMFEQFLRFFVSDLYKALKKLSSMQQREEGAEKSDFTRDVGRIAQETFSSVIGTDDITPLIENGRIMQIISQIVNKKNRFGLVMKIEASEILRAAQTYMNLVESLGVRSEVLPQVFKRVVANVHSEHQEMLHQNDELTSISDALETVSNWLERVAERDPMLFSQLMRRIKLGKHQTVDIVKEVPDVS